MDIVTIHPAGGRETGMKVVGHLFDLADGNVARQQTVELVGQLFGPPSCEHGHRHRYGLRR